MKDVTDAVQLGGRLVCHHLEFDCGIITHELRRAGLGDSCSIWEEIARAGFCTMAPEVGDWTARSADFYKKNPVQTLTTLAKLLLPDDHEAFQAPPHRAGPDTVRLYWAYVTMLEGAKHYRS